MEPTVRVPSAPPSHVRVPPQLEGLRRLAYNLYWTWHPKARALYARINSAAWARSHSPMPVLQGTVDWGRLLDNPDFMSEAHRVIGDFDRYVANGADHWFHRKHARELEGPIAYFCAEYGLHESLGIYSGGLGKICLDFKLWHFQKFAIIPNFSIFQILNFTKIYTKCIFPPDLLDEIICRAKRGILHSV